ncbi:MAG: choice-of-anchor Q domain-containing protein, partial [Polyangiales bacterium]
TMTHALMFGSVAIDMIPQAMCQVDSDQRDIRRPQGSACDVGAFELTGWGVAERISDVGDASSPKVAVDADGNSLAVWSQDDGLGGYTIWANRFTPAAGWGVAERIGTANYYPESAPEVAMDPDGNALAVWSESGSIWADRFMPATGWDVAVRIGGTGRLNAFDAQVAVDPNGDALAVWTQYNDVDSPPQIWANRFMAATGWDVAEPISDAGSVSYPQVAVDPNGNAFAVWAKYTAAGYTIWVNGFTAAAGWGVDEAIGTGSYPSPAPQVATDPNGNALAVWIGYNDIGDQDVWANRFTTVTGWGVAERISRAVHYAASPQVAVDPSGSALVVWEEWRATGSTIAANRYMPATGWGAAGRIAIDEASYAYSPMVAIDPSGNAFAAWSQSGSIWVDRFMPDTGWRAPVPITTGDAGYVYPPQVAFDADGNALAVWSQSGSIWVTRFTGNR